MARVRVRAQLQSRDICASSRERMPVSGIFPAKRRLHPYRQNCNELRVKMALIKYQLFSREFMWLRCGIWLSAAPY